jgi:uncharacterized membrane protein YphA (DoxX/SURF4 family)
MGRPPVALTWAALALRLGLAVTFLIYGVQKFTHEQEYRIVVMEMPLLAPLARAAGAELSVALFRAFEVTIGAALLLPQVVSWAALAQAATLAGLLIVVGYPFSYPRHLGLIGGVAALIGLQQAGLPELAPRLARRLRHPAAAGAAAPARRTADRPVAVRVHAEAAGAARYVSGHWVAGRGRG